MANDTQTLRARLTLAERASLASDACLRVQLPLAACHDPAEPGGRIRYAEDAPLCA
jgi:hypothetical protein